MVAVVPPGWECQEGVNETGCRVQDEFVVGWDRWAVVNVTPPGWWGWLCWALEGCSLVMVDVVTGAPPGVGEWACQAPEG